MAMESDFGAFVKTRRNEMNMTQTELAKKLGIRQPLIAKIEGGYHSPTLSTMERILEALEIKPKEFFNMA